MYTNSPNPGGTSAVKATYERYPEKSIAAKVIITFLAMILTLNNFMLNSKNSLQIRSCAMGTACATSYANIFMARFEQKYIHPFIKGKVDLYLRYIDDIFFIWKGTEEELKNFFNEINKKHPSIKFDQKYSKLKIEFLDVLVYKEEQQRLQKLYLRRTQRDNLIFMQNPTTQRHSKKNIPYKPNTACQKNMFNKQRIRVQKQ